jgi:hypothetical protein
MGIFKHFYIRYKQFFEDAAVVKFICILQCWNALSCSDTMLTDLSAFNYATVSLKRGVYQAHVPFALTFCISAFCPQRVYSFHMILGVNSDVIISPNTIDQLNFVMDIRLALL